VLAPQSEVAHAIVTQIKARLTPLSPAAAAYRGRPVNPEAHEAIQLDQGFAEAHAGLGLALCYLGIFGFRPSAETYPEARLAAQKALAIDESHAGAHTVLADVLKGYDWNLPAAEAEYRRAVELNPSHLLTRLWYADFHSRLGRMEEALAESSRAIALDPVSPLSHNNRAMILWAARRFGEAVFEAKRSLELDPSFVNAFWWMGLSCAHQGQVTQAVQSLSQGLAMSRGSAIFQGALGHVYGLSGDKAKALGTIGELEKLARERYVSPVDFAVVYAGLGDAGAVFHWMEAAFRERATRVHELRRPYFDRFASDARYSSLLRRTGLLAG
jgi:tetratricopeptide (TPR) repeat protein